MKLMIAPWPTALNFLKNASSPPSADCRSGRSAPRRSVVAIQRLRQPVLPLQGRPAAKNAKAQQTRKRQAEK